MFTDKDPKKKEQEEKVNNFLQFGNNVYLTQLAAVPNIVNKVNASQNLHFAYAQDLIKTQIEESKKQRDKAALNIVEQAIKGPNNP